MNARVRSGESAGAFQLVDPFGRRVTYLRLSITDRCNLRCRYCMPEEGVNVLGHDHILSYEELERLAAIFVSLGVDKIRITGGEPFVRKGCLEFMQRLKAQNPSLRLHLTTNGVAVLPYLNALKQLDIGGINLSLDTLDQTRFFEITRRDRLETVLAVFNEIQRLGLPLKVNAVIQPDTRDEELLQLASLVKDAPVALRFIELMPFSGSKKRERLQTEPIEERLQRLFPEMVENAVSGVETARRFTIPGYAGTLGIIEGESRKFCTTCNKLRITSSGMLKNCLYDKGVLDMRTLLRSEPDDARVATEIIRVVGQKLRNGYEVARLHEADCQDSMASIGG
ncbi:GTP 3',8-cyclase MoaA [Desulfopila aestuarii]|uniref:GTP 3',8-cyclase n=1 Tax=Desulfopila aestuarii DSM 18488 TaxID=1121416 RepID=A0A1M7Y5I0_9BACT|nr:GTP 3',8-cyclase MoaA [Desulfopila aestuarii]SHO47797.1 cyclic pyranopterin phosphate synthase [Desulfopila aestuarii DSM 18488]